MSSISFLVCQFCAREANVVRYTKGHVYRKVTPHAIQTTILHGCLQETYSSLTGSVRSGFPCECVSSQFLWVTRASCVHRMVVGIMCVDWCLPSGILVAHMGVDSLIAGFSLCACDFIRPSLVVAASLETVGGAHQFAGPNRTLSNRERIFAPTQVGTFVTECRQGHVREHTARIR